MEIALSEVEAVPTVKKITNMLEAQSAYDPKLRPHGRSWILPASRASWWATLQTEWYACSMLDDTKKIIISRDVTFEESIGMPKDNEKNHKDKMRVLLEDHETAEEQQHVNDEELNEPKDNSVEDHDNVNETEKQEDAEAEEAVPVSHLAAEHETRYPQRERRPLGAWFKAALATEKFKE
jgi:hypothetical protein